MFRLNQDEYNRLNTASTAAGVRSLSEFVRTRVLRAVNEPEFAGFEKRLDEVNRTLAQLIQRVADEAPAPAGGYSARRSKTSRS